MCLLQIHDNTSQSHIKLIFSCVKKLVPNVLLLRSSKKSYCAELVSLKHISY